MKSRYIVFLSSLLFVFVLAQSAAIGQVDRKNYNFNKAKEYYDSENYRQAINYFNKQLQADPYEARSLYWRGLAHYNLTLYTKAIDDLSASIRNNYEYMGYAYHWRGQTYYQLEQYEEAIRDFTNALNKDYEQVEYPYYWRGMANYNAGNYRAAVQDHTQAIRNNYESIEYAYYNRANAYYMLDEYDMAISDYTSAISNSYPNVDYARYWRGMSYYSNGDYDAARDDFDYVVSSNSAKKNDALEYLAELNNKNKRWDNDDADITAPKITIYEPNVQKSRGLVNEEESSIYVRGAATDESGIKQVSINGSYANVKSDGSFDAYIDLAYGTNTIYVIATDTKGNVAEEQFTVNRTSTQDVNDIVNVTEEKRVALVIGNSDYDSAPLKNPANDAEDMAKTLEKLGFEVMKFINIPKKDDMVKAVREFGNKIQDGGVGLFYYAGHGMQMNGVNYLIPTKAAIDKEIHVEFEAINLDMILAEMEYARNRMNIVVLDACRNNPFARSFRSNTPGLASLTRSPSGTFIAYATAPNSVASDGTGDNGLYTEELLKQLNVPGQKIEEVFKNVRINVMERTGDEQVPWESSSIKGDFFFNR